MQKASHNGRPLISARAFRVTANIVLFCIAIIAAFAAFDFSTLETHASAVPRPPTQEPQPPSTGLAATVPAGTQPIDLTTDTEWRQSALPPTLDTVEIETAVRLDVPLVNQLPTYPTGCEAASVTMLLHFLQVDVTLDDVVQTMPYSTDDDPDNGFVGDPRNAAGWTIYPPAFLPVIKSYAGSAVDLTGASLDTFKRYLSFGQPIVCWINWGGDFLHCVIITGYDEQHFYYNDPYGTKDVPVAYTTLETIRTNIGNRALSY